jgi:hypothetical protein
MSASGVGVINRASSTRRSSASMVITNPASCHVGVIIGVIGHVNHVDHRRHHRHHRSSGNLIV